jgi:hypothetical protein
MVRCKICNRKFSSFIGLSNHLKAHKVIHKNYYDEYYKKENEGLCVFCDEPTSFINIKVGYQKHCNNKCSASDPKIIETKQRNTDWEKFREAVKKGRNKEGVSEKIKQTNLSRYGYENPFQSKEIQEQKKETYMKNYGVDNPAKCPVIQRKIKETCIKRELTVSDDKRDEFLLYSLKVRSLTKKNKKILFELWDGHDYYDGEYIGDNLLLNFNDRKYPTVDHKISLLKGFLNNISVEEIAGIDNLCITKKNINSSKSNRGVSNEI